MTTANSGHGNGGPTGNIRMARAVGLKGKGITRLCIFHGMARLAIASGPTNSFDPGEPYAKKRVIRGGSFLCNESYCTGYRVSRRMKSTEDSGMEHLGFRCVKDL